MDEYKNENPPVDGDFMSTKTLLNHGVAWLFAALGMALILYGICGL